MGRCVKCNTSLPRKTSKLCDSCATFTCTVCGKKFVLNRYQRHRYVTGETKRFFCSRRCYDKAKVGSGNPKWRGGKTINGGYVYLYRPDHPYATKDGYVLEHRLVMEKVLGRYLKPDESIHHIDGNTLNNDPSNLMVLPEPQHRALHARYRTRTRDGKFAGRLKVAAFV